MLEDLAFLTLRATAGTLLAGHGAQKLFGWFEGPGLHGTRGWLESMGIRPGHPWAIAAGLSEFGGGVLTLLGLGGPLGQLGIMGAMGMATVKVHAGKPIWVTTGGAELPVTNMAIAAALMLAGPGKFSIDEALGIRLPRWLAIPGLAVVAAAVYAGAFGQAGEEEAPKEEAGGELQAGNESGRPLETPATERTMQSERVAGQG